MRTKSPKPDAVVVTGGAGYIGSVLVRRLLADGYSVRVVDTLRWGGAALAEWAAHPRFAFFHADICDGASLPPIIEGTRAVVHLAAMVGDPACQAEPDLARRVNVHGSKALFSQAQRAGCERFIFVSTCSNYGRMASPDGLVDELTPLAPMSLYAQTKVAIEKALLEATRDHACKPTILRFATAYGASPRMRFDLTVNDFVRELSVGRELVVFGEQFWRPYCHVEDLSRAVCRVLERPLRDVAWEVFNVGDSAENYTKAMLLAELQKHFPCPRVRFVAQDSDPRDYRVNCDKIRERLGFHITRRVPDGIAEVARLISSGLISDPDAPQYSNAVPVPSTAHCQPLLVQ